MEVNITQKKIIQIELSGFFLCRVKIRDLKHTWELGRQRGALEEICFQQEGTGYDQIMERSLAHQGPGV